MISIALTKWVFRINAVINWTLPLASILDPIQAASLFGGGAPAYPSIVRLWSGLVFMFGFMFWETSRNVVKKRALIKYNWIEKSITAGTILFGYFWVQDIPERLMVLIILTNVLWIPVILYCDLAVARSVRATT